MCSWSWSWISKRIIQITVHNGYPVAPDKMEIKGEMLFDYQLKIADLYNIPIGILLIIK